ncbi:Holliday junction ATP-dependent DNA helicase RuvB [Planctomycetales bacterium 10988]|nr:Holliday junction ATP-dependent DNA helicase RuvB [Planctomycetales bacterium 10988]
MARERIVSADDALDDLPEPERVWDELDNHEQALHEKLRPSRLEDVIGQREVVERLMIALDAARKRSEPLGHILFDGPPGLGKTTFANVIPKEMGTSLQIANGSAMTAPKDILPYLTNASEGSVLFIDEIHRLPMAVEEFIYPVMEDFRVDVTLGDGLNARTINMQLRPFTIIGATTRSGMLSGPLRNRFQLREHLEFYNVEDLTEIIRRNASKLKVGIDDLSAEEIGRRSRGTPRLANNLLRWVRDYATSRADGSINLELARAALEMQGVDEQGLDSWDRKYLQTLIRIFGGGPAGIDAIAHTMNVAVDTLHDEIEPFLLRMEFIVRSPRGRLARQAAFDHMGMQNNLDTDQRRLF